MCQNFPGTALSFSKYVTMKGRGVARWLLAKSNASGEDGTISMALKSLTLQEKGKWMSIMQQYPGLFVKIQATSSQSSLATRF